MDNKTFTSGLQVLLLYDSETHSLTASEISKRLGYSISKTYRLIRTLVQFDLLKENRQTASYSLGRAIIRLGLLAQKNFQLPGVAQPFMKELSLLTKETVLLVGLEGSRGICLELVESAEPIRFSLFQPGWALPIHAGAAPKAIMAHLPENEWDRIISMGLKRYTPNTITDPEFLRADLRDIRRRGYAFSNQETELDVWAVAAPILTGTGEPLAALAVAGPAFRLNKREVPALGKLVVQYAQKIGYYFGGSRDPKGALLNSSAPAIQKGKEIPGRTARPKQEGRARLRKPN
jgi:IclR family acetate operon transcriptional repressor